jgi:exopolyphosphatase/guanosine-5'-triphosphate,3'-diphosphate pyrophosphatase
LSEAAALRTLEAVAAFTQRIRLAGADSAGIATSAMRRARNAVEFGEQFRAVAGTPLRVLSGAEEAAATFRGAMFGAPRDGAIRAVLDVGGGSTECATGRDGRLERERSVEIGSVRLTEQYPELTGSAPGAAARAAASRARTAIAAELGWLASFRPVAEVRAVAGTPLTLGAIARRSSPEDVAGELLERSTIESIVERLLEMNLEERRAVEGMIAQRADILVAGGLIVSEALRLLERSAARLEVNDLLLGYLLGEFALERSPQ